MHSDFKELLAIFNAHGVKYLIVGGYAVSFHAQPRATKDLDLFVSRDAANAHAIYQALAAFGAPLAGVTPEDYLDPDGFFRMGNPPIMVELLPAIQGIDFATAARPRDLADVDAIRKAGETREN